MAGDARFRWALFAWLLLSGGPAIADEPAAEKVSVTEIVTGLNAPTDLVVSPQGDLFIAESAAGRVVRVVGNKVVAVVTGFAVDQISAQGESARGYGVGPLSLAFIDERTFVVGSGGLPAGEDVARVFEVPPLGETITVADAIATLGPWAAGASSQQGEGDFVAVQVIRDAKSNVSILLACGGDESKGWLGRVKWNGEAGDRSIEPFISAISTAGGKRPTAMAIANDTPRGHLVIAQAEDADGQQKGQLAYFDLHSRRLLMKASLALPEISGLAYSTRSQQFYATDSRKNGSQRGGLYRLEQKFEDGQPLVHANQIVPLDGPTALVFAPNGTLFVTVLGAADSNNDEPSGKLVKIESGL